MMTAVATAQMYPVYAVEEISVVPNPPKAGEPTEICCEVTNPTASPVDIQLQFAWAELGIGIPFNPINGLRPVHLPPSSMVKECIYWIPPLSGPVSIQVEFIRTGYETIWAQHNLDIDESLLPGVPRPRTFKVGNPTESPAHISLGLIPHIPGWALELSQDVLYNMAPGSVQTVTLTVTPPDELPQDGTIIVDVEGFIEGELIGGFRKVYSFDQNCAFSEPASSNCAYPREISGAVGHHVVMMDAHTATDTGTLCSVSVGSMVYFSVTPDVSGPLTVSTCHPSTMYDTVLEVTTDWEFCSPGTLVACNDDFSDENCPSLCNGRPSQLTFDANAGQSYLIRVGVYNNNPGGCPLCLGLIVTIGEPCGDPPRNFLCELARELPGDSGIHEVEIDVTDAPSNPESWCSLSNIGHGVWFSFTPTIDGIATFTTCHPNTDYDTVVRARTGECGGIMADLTCNDDTVGGDCSACGMDNRGSRISFSVNAGQPYYLEVGAYDDNVAGCELCLGTYLTIETDGDGIPDDLDNCPETQNGPYAGTCTRGAVGVDCMSNEDCGVDGFCSMDQEDADGDGMGDVCDPDDDNDGICDPGESDPSCSGSDNCPTTPNGPDVGTCTQGSDIFIGESCMDDTDCGDFGFCSKNQGDSYPPGGNGCGDACECEGDFEPDGDVDGTDALMFKADFFRNDCNTNPPCNGDFNCDGDVDGTDALMFKADFFRSDCPSCSGWPCVYE
jgi:hypothetical protein